MSAIEPPSDCPDDDLLPCGCLLRYSVVDGVNTMTVSPCRQSCPNLAAVLGLGRDKGIDPRYRRG